MAQQDLVRSDPIVLARTPSFRLAGIEVRPATRQVVRNGRSETLEPRVMQLLVALAEAGGEIVTRDELVMRCWDGRIVGENAIHRAVSRLRDVALEFAGGAFRVETIPRVGYRIAAGADEDVDGEGAATLPAGASGPSRRGLILGGGAAALAAAGVGAWLYGQRPGHRPQPEALELYRRGQIAQRQGQAEQVRQAIAVIHQATELDPLYADAWGGLALSYRHILEGYAQGEVDSLPGLIQSAARRALALDPANADAQVALALVRPYYRNWIGIEAELLRLAERHADHWFVQAQLGIIRYEVGRWSDGFAHTERQIQIEPFIPIPHYVRARALWSLGRLQEAEATLLAASRRWPASSQIWTLRFHFLLFTGRPAEAAAFVANPQLRPEALQAEMAELLGRLSRAAASRAAAEVEASLSDLGRQVGAQVQSIQWAAPAFLLLGRPDRALEALERYYLGGSAGAFGAAAAAPGPYHRRYASFLFMPNLAPLRAEPRFRTLLERIGLEDYWRRTGTLPDYRRASA